MKKTSTEWCNLSGIEVIDPDGWNQSTTKDFNDDWNKKITINQFWDRVNHSTVRFPLFIKTIKDLRMTVFAKLSLPLFVNA